MKNETESAPAGRREARKAERRAAIIAIATSLFLEHGYDRMSMSGIIDQIGGSKATLWSYFASKEELFAAVIDDATRAFRAVMQTELDPRRDVVEVLNRFAEKFVARVTEPDAIALQRLIIGEVERFPAIGRIFYDRAPGISRALLTEYFASCMALGVLREDDPDAAASMLMSLCVGAYHSRVLGKVEVATAAAGKKEAARAAQQFLRCYLPSS